MGSRQPARVGGTLDWGVTFAPLNWNDLVNMSAKTQFKADLTKFPSRDAWSRAWQKHWSQVGLHGYELPAAGPGGDDRRLLTIARTPQKERARLKRISAEFEI